MNDVDFFDKDEQITRILSIRPIPRSRFEDNEKRTCIEEVKEEIVSECRSMIDQLQDEFGRVQVSFQKRHQKAEMTFQSIHSRQRECAISQADLGLRIDQIEDQKELLRGDLLSMKDDVNSMSLPSSNAKLLTPVAGSPF